MQIYPLAGARKAPQDLDHFVAGGSFDFKFAAVLRTLEAAPEFGPVTLLYAESNISLSGANLVLPCEPYPDNESALRRVARLKETADLFLPLIVDDDGTVIWSGPELLHECGVANQTS